MHKTENISCINTADIPMSRPGNATRQGYITALPVRLPPSIPTKNKKAIIVLLILPGCVWYAVYLFYLFKYAIKLTFGK